MRQLASTTKEGKLFKNESDAYKYMWENSVQKQNRGKGDTSDDFIETLGLILSDGGVLVLPQEGFRFDGEYFKNSLGEAEMAVYKLEGKGESLTVEYMGKKYSVVAQIHTHPDIRGFYPQPSGRDERASKLYNIPIFTYSGGDRVFYTNPRLIKNEQVGQIDLNLLKGDKLFNLIKFIK